MIRTPDHYKGYQEAITDVLGFIDLYADSCHGNDIASVFNRLKLQKLRLALAENFSGLQRLKYDQSTDPAWRRKQLHLVK